VLPRLQKVYDYLVTRDWGAAFKRLPETLGAVGTNLKDMLKLFVMRGAEGEIIAGPLTETFLTAFRWLGEQIRALFHWLWQDVLEDMRTSLAEQLRKLSIGLAGAAQEARETAMAETARKKWEAAQIGVAPWARKKWEELEPEKQRAWTKEKGEIPLTALPSIVTLEGASNAASTAMRAFSGTMDEAQEKIWQAGHEARIAAITEKLGQTGFAAREEFGAKIDNLIHALTRGLPGTAVGGVPGVAPGAVPNAALVAALSAALVAAPSVAPQVTQNITIQGVMTEAFFMQQIVPRFRHALQLGGIILERK